MCDRCTRVVCSKHIPLPKGTVLGVSIFLCVACHIRAFSKPVPYFVSFYRFVACCYIYVIPFVLFLFFRAFTRVTSLYWPIHRTPGNPSFPIHPF